MAKPILVAICAAAVAAPAVSARTALVIKVKSHTTAAVQFERAPKGAAGDVYVFRSRLTNATRQFGKRAGAIVGIDNYTVRYPTATTWTTKGTTTLPGGTLKWAGSGRFLSGRTIGTTRITAGTGDFRGATGVLTSGTGANPLNTYKLSLP
jgi:hypothetical protein